jgi:dimethylhistidine N-methyltransferase
MKVGAAATAYGYTSFNKSSLAKKAPRTAIEIDSHFRRDVLSGLALPQKRIGAKYFYDERGSQLFDRICDLEEYYPTRTELSLLQENAKSLAALLGPRCRIIELGSGSSTKTRALLDRMVDVAQYAPIDISREHLLDAAARTRLEYPSIEVVPVCADYTNDFALPRVHDCARDVAFFPGSTIGNFEPTEATDFLRRVKKLVGRDGAIVIGVDLKKDPNVLHAAYNDRQGVTAQFNLNLLDRINRELGADFDVDRFRHYAFYSPEFGRIEMHLGSIDRQRAHVGDAHFSFAAGEAIKTEHSYKYSVDQFRDLAHDAGLSVARVWIDKNSLFSVQILQPISERS